MEVPELVKPIQIDYDTVKAEKDDIILSTRYEGYISPTNIEEIYFTVSNSIIKEVYVKEGQHVEKGDVIAEIDMTSLDEQITSQEKSIERTKISNKYTNDANERSKKLLEMELEELYKDLNIYQELKDVTPASTIETLERNIQLKKTSIEQKEMDIRHTLENQEFELNLKYKTLEELKEKRNYDKVCAGVSGEVLYVESLSSGDKVTAYKTIAVIADMSDLSVLSNTTSLPLAKKYINLYIGDKKYTGTVLERKELGEQIKIAVDGAKTEDLKVGQFVDIEVVTRVRDNVLTIPTNALVKNGSEYYVYVVENNAKIKRNVKIGTKGAVKTEIEEGLTEGEDVFVGVSAKDNDTEYVTAEVTLGNIQNFNYVSGNTQPSIVENLYFSFTQSEARLVELNVQRGTNVKKGDIIAKVELEGNELTISTQKLELEALKKDFEDNKRLKQESIEEAKEEIAQLQADYELNVSTGFYTRRELEKDLQEIEKKKVSLESSQESYEKYVWEKEYSISSKEEELYELENNYEETVIIAPFDGTITDVTKLKENQLIKSSNLVATIASEEEPVLVCSSKAAGLMYGMDVKATISTYEINGKIISAQSAIPTTVTEDAPTIVKFEEDERVKLNIKGSQISIFVLMKELDNIVLVDKNAVNTFDGESWVYILEDGVKKQRNIVVGLSDAKNCQVLEGLEPGQQVIISQEGGRR